MQELAVVAGVMSTTLFVVSYLPMLHRAVRTKDLASYSRPSLVLANVGNVIQAVYVYSLPVGPIWFLHSFYLVASALMLTLHLRHITNEPAVIAVRRRLVGRRLLGPRTTVNQGGHHDDDDERQRRPGRADRQPSDGPAGRGPVARRERL